MENFQVFSLKTDEQVKENSVVVAKLMKSVIFKALRKRLKMRQITSFTKLTTKIEYSLTCSSVFKLKT